MLIMYTIFYIITLPQLIASLKMRLDGLILWYFQAGFFAGFIIQTFLSQSIIPVETLRQTTKPVSQMISLGYARKRPL